MSYRIKAQRKQWQFWARWNKRNASQKQCCNWHLENTSEQMDGNTKGRKKTTHTLETFCSSSYRLIFSLVFPKFQYEPTGPPSSSVFNAKFGTALLRKRKKTAKKGHWGFDATTLISRLKTRNAHRNRLSRICQVFGTSFWKRQFFGIFSTRSVQSLWRWYYNRLE